MTIHKITTFQCTQAVAEKTGHIQIDVMLDTDWDEFIVIPVSATGHITTAQYDTYDCEDALSTARAMADNA